MVRDRETARARMLRAGLLADEADSYLASYPPETWAEIIEWAESPPAIDACDDYEADFHYA